MAAQKKAVNTIVKTLKSRSTTLFQPLRAMRAAARQATGNMNKMMIGVSSLKIGRDGFKNNQRNKSCKDTPAVHGAVAANTT